MWNPCACWLNSDDTWKTKTHPLVCWWNLLVVLLSKSGPKWWWNSITLAGEKSQLLSKYIYTHKLHRYIDHDWGWIKIPVIFSFWTTHCWFTNQVLECFPNWIWLRMNNTRHLTLDFSETKQRCCRKKSTSVDFFSSIPMMIPIMSKFAQKKRYPQLSSDGIFPYKI